MKILIAIHGARSQPEHMRAQRETWLADLQADYRFFLGQPEGDEPDAVYSDFPDGPLCEGKICRTWVGNRKTEAIAHYALAHDYDFVFKCDDDTYVRPRLLLESGFAEHDYSGCADTHYTIKLGWYRWAQGGAGYWLSRRAMEIVAEHGLSLIPAEDFNVGNILAEHGIHPRHDERYAPQVTQRQLESDRSLITMHKISPESMLRLHGREPSTKV